MNIDPKSVNLQSLVGRAIGMSSRHVKRETQQEHRNMKIKTMEQTDKTLDENTTSEKIRCILQPKTCIQQIQHKQIRKCSIVSYFSHLIFVLNYSTLSRACKFIQPQHFCNEIWTKRSEIISCIWFTLLRIFLERNSL